jgi:hypothetical protein
MALLRPILRPVLRPVLNSVLDRFGGLIARNNTVGPIPVTSESYDTNDGVTARTVGAAGDHATVFAAFNVSSLGDVIEIIDDVVTETLGLNITTGVDGGGKAIKIKGKSTKSTWNLAAVSFPILMNSAVASIEFENISFVESTAANPFYSLSSVINGFNHFINCDFNFAGNINIYNPKEAVFDGCTDYS